MFQILLLNLNSTENEWMKTIFNFFLTSGFLLFLNSCVPIQELDESYNQMEQTYVTNTNNGLKQGINFPIRYTPEVPKIEMGFFPPVDFNDPLQTNMSKNGSANIPTKRSGSNSNTYPGSFDHSPRK